MSTTRYLTQNTTPAMLELARQHGAMVEAAIIRGDEDMAIAAVRRAFRVRGNDEPVQADSFLSTLLPPRLASILARDGIDTLSDLCACTRARLLEVRSVSCASIEVIEVELEKHGLRLRD